MVFKTQSDTLSLSGAAVHVDAPAALREGWKLVPYYAATPQPVRGRRYIAQPNAESIGLFCNRQVLLFTAIHREGWEGPALKSRAPGRRRMRNDCNHQCLNERCERVSMIVVEQTPSSARVFPGAEGHPAWP